MDRHKKSTSYRQAFLNRIHFIGGIFLLIIIFTGYRINQNVQAQTEIGGIQDTDQVYNLFNQWIKEGKDPVIESGSSVIVSKEKQSTAVIASQTKGGVAIQSTTSITLPSSTISKRSTIDKLLGIIPQEIQETKDFLIREGFEETEIHRNNSKQSVLKGNKSLNFKHNNGKIITPLIIASVIASQTKGGVAIQSTPSIEVYFPEGTQLTISQETPFTGTIIPPTIIENTDTENKIIFHVGATGENIQFNDTNQNTSTVQIKVAVPLSFVGQPLIIRYSPDNTLRQHLTTSIATIDPITNEAYVTFETSHFTYFYIGTYQGTFTINNDDPYTTNTSVTLYNNASGANQMRFGNSLEQLSGASWETYSSTKTRTLSGEVGSGVRTVYVEYRNTSTNLFASTQDSIVYGTNDPDTALKLYYFGTGSTFTENRSITTGCDISSISIQNVPSYEDNSSNRIPAIQANTIYVFNSGTHLSTGIVEFLGNCSVVAGTGSMYNQTSNVTVYTFDIKQSNIYIANKNYNIVDNLSVNGTGSSVSPHIQNNYGIYIYSGSKNNTINNVKSFNFQRNLNDRGIYLNTNVEYNTINNSQMYNASYGLGIDNSSRYNIIKNSKIFNTNYGAFISQSTRNILQNIQIYNNPYYGLHITNSSNQNYINNIQIFNNGSNPTDLILGISSSDNNTINNCQIYNNIGHGITIGVGSDQNIINNCNIYNNKNYGIYINAGSTNYLNNIKLFNNLVGIYLIGNTTNNKYYGNLELLENDGTIVGIISGLATGLQSDFSSLGWTGGTLTINSGCYRCGNTTSPISSTSGNLMNTGIYRACQMRGRGATWKTNPTDTITYTYGISISKQTQPVIYSGGWMLDTGFNFNTNKFIAEINNIGINTDINSCLNCTGTIERDNSNYINSGFRASGATSCDISKALYGTSRLGEDQTAYSQYRSGAYKSGNLCDRENTRVQFVEPGTGTIPINLASHTIYVLSGDGNYISTGTINTNNCSAIIAKSNVELFSTGQLSNGNIYNNNKYNNIFDNLKINGTGTLHPTTKNNNGIYIYYQSKNNTIKDSIIYNTNNGIYINNTVSYTDIQNIKTYNNTYGIYINISSTNIKIENSKIYNNTIGISYQDNITNSNINNSEIYNNNNIGINIRTNSNYNSINNSQIYNNTNQGYSSNSSYNTINNSQIYNNLDGFVISAGNNNTINNSQIYNNARNGINIDVGSGNIINNTKSINNLVGIYLQGNSRNNRYYGTLDILENDGTIVGTTTGLVTGLQSDFSALGWTGGTLAINSGCYRCGNTTSPISSTSGNLMNTGIYRACQMRGRDATWKTNPLDNITYIYGTGLAKQSQPVKYTSTSWNSLTNDTGTTFNPNQFIAEINNIGIDTDLTCHNCTGTIERDNSNYINSLFRASGATSCDISKALYGTGRLGEDQTAYSQYRVGTYKSGNLCDRENTRVQYIEPGTSTLPINLSSHTIYVLSGAGNYITTGTINTNNCSAIIAKTGVELISSIQLNTNGSIYNNGKKNNIFDNLKINGTGSLHPTTRNINGIYLQSATNNTINNSKIYNNNQVGIRSYTSNYNYINNIETNNNNDDGISLEGTSQYNTINNSKIYNNFDYGINMGSSAKYTKIYNSIIYNNTNYGIGFSTSNEYNEINNCQIYNNGSKGIIFNNSSRYNTINNSQIYNNNSYGIDFMPGSNNNILNNSQVYNNVSYGIYIQTSNYNTINNSQIYNNTSYGIGINIGSGNLFNNINIYNNSGILFVSNNTGNKYYGTTKIFGTTNYIQGATSTGRQQGTGLENLGRTTGEIITGGEMSWDYITNPKNSSGQYLLPRTGSRTDVRGKKTNITFDDNMQYSYGYGTKQQKQPVLYNGTTLITGGTYGTSARDGGGYEEGGGKAYFIGSNQTIPIVGRITYYNGQYDQEGLPNFIAPGSSLDISAQARRYTVRRANLFGDITQYKYGIDVINTPTTGITFTTGTTSKKVILQIYDDGGTGRYNHRGSSWDDQPPYFATHFQYTTNIDTTPPTSPTLISPTSGTSFNTFPINLVWSSAIDTGAGISGYVYQISTGTTFTNILQSGTTYTTGVAIANLPFGNNYRRVYAFDIANNTGTRSEYRTIQIEAGAPYVSQGYISVGNTGNNGSTNYYNGTINIRADVTDMGGGLSGSTCKYTTDGTTRNTALYNSSPSYCYINNLTPNTDINIKFTIKDDIGTIGTGGTGTYLYDNQAPINGSFLINNGASTTTNPNATFNITCPTDSGISGIQLAYGTSANPTNRTGICSNKSISLGDTLGIKTGYVIFKDALNNQTTQYIQTINLVEAGSIQDAYISNGQTGTNNGKIFYKGSINLRSDFSGGFSGATCQYSINTRNRYQANNTSTYCYINSIQPNANINIQFKGQDATDTTLYSTIGTYHYDNYPPATKKTWLRLMPNLPYEGTTISNGYSISSDEESNTYVGGEFQGGSLSFGDKIIYNSGSSDVFLFKRTSTGYVERAKKIGGTANEYIRSIDMDNEGNIYTQIMYYGTFDLDGNIIPYVGLSDTLLIKISNTGQLLRYNIFYGSQTEWILKTTVNNKGNTIHAGYINNGTSYFGGQSLTTSGGYDGILIQTTSTGTVDRIKKLGGAGNEVIRSININTTNNDIYMIGDYGNTTIFEGQTLYTSGFRDIVVAKFSTTGQLLWINKLGGTAEDLAQDIDIDTNGNTYITFYSAGTITTPVGTITNSGSYDAVIAKLSSTGQLLWINKLGGTTDDKFMNIKINKYTNQVYIGGQYNSSTISFGNLSLGNSGGYDIIIGEINPINGQPLRIKKSNGPQDERLNNITIGNNGNIYAIGKKYGNIAMPPALKLDNLSFTSEVDSYRIAEYENSDGSFTINSGATSTNNANVTFNITCPTDNGIGGVQVAYGTSANPTNRTGICGDKSIYMGTNGLKTGYVRFKDAFDNISDNIAQTITINSPIILGTPSISPQQNGFYSGSITLNASVQNPYEGALTCKYSLGTFGRTTATFNTNTCLTTISPATHINVQFLATTGSTTGYSTRSTFFYDRYHPLIKTGMIRSFTTSNNSTPYSADIKTNASGNIYVLGNSNGNQNRTNIVIEKYTSGGNRNRSIESDGQSYSTHTKAEAMSKDNYNNLYIAASVQGDWGYGDPVETYFGSYTIYTPTNGGNNIDIIVAKVQDGGTWQWITDAGGDGKDRALAIQNDNDGNVYVGGYFNTTASFGSTNLTSNGDDDIFVGKLNNAGQWLRSTGAGSSSSDRAKTIDIDLEGNIYVGGYFNGTASFGSTNLTSSGNKDGFISKLTNTGQWVRSTKIGGTSADEILDLKLDISTNHIYIAGYFSNTMTIDTTTLTSSGGTDGFIAKFTTGGTLVRAKKVGGIGNDAIQKIDRDHKGDVYIGGYFNNSITIGNTGRTSSGGKDTFIAKISNNGQRDRSYKSNSADDRDLKGISTSMEGYTHFSETNSYSWYETDNFLNYNTNILRKYGGNTKNTVRVSIAGGEYISNMDSTIRSVCPNDFGVGEVSYGYGTSMEEPLNEEDRSTCTPGDSIGGQFIGYQQGINTGYIIYKDILGNKTPRFSDSIIIDTIAPILTWITPPTPVHNSTTTDTTFTGKLQINEPNLTDFQRNRNGQTTSLYDSGLILMMNFDNITNLGELTGTRAKDRSTYGHIATGINTPTRISNGKFDGAYHFSGNKYFTINNHSKFNNLGDFTISLRVNPGSSQPSYSDIIDKHNCSSSAWTIQQNNNLTNQYYFAFYTNNTRQGLTTTTTLNANQRQHFVVIKSGDRILHYKNNTLTANGQGHTGIVVNNTSPIKIGYGCESRYFSGQIDEVRVRNRALTSGEIEALYKTNLAKTSSTGWQFDATYTNVNDGKQIFTGYAKDVVNLSSSSSRTYFVDKYPIIREYYGTGNGADTKYTETWTGWTSQCNTGNMTVEIIPGGTDTLPQYLSPYTMYVLTGDVYVNHEINSATCTSIIGSGTQKKIYFNDDSGNYPLNYLINNGYSYFIVDNIELNFDNAYMSAYYGIYSTNQNNTFHRIKTQDNYNYTSVYGIGVSANNHNIKDCDFDNMYPLEIGGNNNIIEDIRINQNYYNYYGGYISIGGSNNQLSGINITNGQYGIVINGSNNTIENTTIEYADYAGIYIYNGADSNSIYNSTIRNNSSSDPSYGGIEIDGSNNTIDNCTFHDNNERNIYNIGYNNIIQDSDTYGSNHGIYEQGYDTIISGNKIRDNSYGIYLDQTSNTNIIGNEIYKNYYYGVNAYASDSTTIENSNIYNNGTDGIYADGADSLHIKNSKIFNNGAYGINIISTYDIGNRSLLAWGPQITNSLIFNNTSDGIYLGPTEEAIISGSQFFNNGGNGILIDGPYSYNNKINNTDSYNNGSYGINIGGQMDDSTQWKYHGENKIFANNAGTIGGYSGDISAGTAGGGYQAGTLTTGLTMNCSYGINLYGPTSTALFDFLSYPNCTLRARVAGRSTQTLNQTSYGYNIKTIPQISGSLTLPNYTSSTAITATLYSTITTGYKLFGHFTTTPIQNIINGTINQNITLNTPDGAKTLIMQLGSGNKLTHFVQQSILDTTSPTISGAQNEYMYTGNLLIEIIETNYSGSYINGTFTGAQSFWITQNGTNTITGYDLAGNHTTIVFSLNLDSIPPTVSTGYISSGITGENNGNLYYKGTITIQTNVSDANGISGSTCEYTINNGTNRSSASYNEGICYVDNLTPNTDITINFRIKDTSNNIGTGNAETYIYDNTSPSTSSLISPINNIIISYNYTSLIWGTSTDLGIGLSGYKFELSTGNDFTTTITSGYTQASGINILNLPENTYYRRVYAIDKLNNTGSRSSTYSFTYTTAYNVDIEHFYGTGNGTHTQYTYNRTGRSSDCNTENMNIIIVNPGTETLLFQTDGYNKRTNDNTLYILNSGNYMFTGEFQLGSCTVLHGSGNVEISTENNVSRLISNKLGSTGFSIINNIKFDGEKNHSGSKNGELFYSAIEDKNITFNNLWIYNFQEGISLRDNTQHLLIQNSKIFNNGQGITSWGGINYNIINNCQIFNNQYHGIRLGGAHHNTINNTQIYNNDFGIHIFSYSSYGDNYENTISNSLIYNNNKGLFLEEYNTSQNVYNNRINNTKIYNNTQYGIEIGTNTENLYYHGDNTIFSNGTNIYGETNQFLTGNNTTFPGILNSGQVSYSGPINCMQITNPRNGNSSLLQTGTNCENREYISSWTYLNPISFVRGDNIIKQISPISYIDNTTLTTNNFAYNTNNYIALLDNDINLYPHHLLSHTSGYFSTIPTITLTGTAQIGKTIILSGSSIIGTSSIVNINGNWSGTITMSEGTNNISIHSQDEIGIFYTTYITVYTDTTPPIISGASHGQTYTEHKFIEIIESNYSGAYINGVFTGAQSFWITQNGTNTITGYDFAGNYTGITITLDLDITPPIISTGYISSGTTGENDGNLYYKGTINIQANVSDDYGINTSTCEYSTGGSTRYSASYNTNICYVNNLTPNANISINFRVKDTSDNLGTGIAQTYIYDNTGPSVPTLVSPTDQSGSKNSIIQLQWNTSDDLGIGTSGYVRQISTENNFSTILYSGITTTTGATTSSLNNNTYYRRVYAKDKFNNTGSRSSTYSFYIDAEIPQLLFTGDTPTHLSMTNNTTFSGTLQITEPFLNTLQRNRNGSLLNIYDDDLVLMANFDNITSLGEISGSVVKDFSIYNNTGTLTHGSRSNFGKYNGSYLFTGSPGCITYQVKPNQTEGTLSIRFNRKYPAANKMIIGNYSGGTANNRFYIYDNGSYFQSNIGKDNAYLNIAPIDNNIWHNIIMIRKDSNYKVYFDNELKINTSYVQWDNLQEYTSIGCNPNPYPTNLGPSWSGYIDEVRMRKRAISTGEVQQLYYSNLNKYDTDKWNLTYIHTGLADGTYTFTGSATDTLGNTSQTGRTYTIDSTSTVYFTGYTPASGTTINTPTFSGQAEIIEQFLDTLERSRNGSLFNIYDSGLVLMMNFDNITSLGETTGVVIKDRSHYENHGTGINSPTRTPNGKFGGAYQFDGINDYIELFDYEPTSTTFNIWIKTVNNNKDQRILHNGHQGGSSSYPVSYSLSYAGISKTVRWIIGDSNGGSIYISSNSGIIQNNEWHMITATFNEQTYKLELYVDGILQSTGQQTHGIIHTPEVLKVSYYRAGDTQTVSGYLDEFRAWNKVLSSGEIQKIYNSNLAKISENKRTFEVQETCQIEGTHTYSLQSTDTVGNTGSDTRTVHIQLPTIAVGYPLSGLNMPEITVPKTGTTVEQHFTGTGNYFRVNDTKGYTGWNTTIQLSGNLVGTTYTGNYIPASKVQFKGSGTIQTLEGTESANVMLATGVTQYQTMTGIIDYILKYQGPDCSSCKLGKYGNLPSLKIDIPAFQIPDNYQSTIVFTIFQ